MNMNINIKLGNMEVRKYKGFNDPKIDGINVRETYEFIKWYNDNGDKPYCCVVAFAEKTSEGYDIRTVGSRPWDLDSSDFDDYNKLVRAFFSCTNVF